MPEQKLSRKTLKTIKSIKLALAQFMENKALKDITVQEVADKAEISRTTLYKYFYDVYDIYEQIEREVLTEIGMLTLKYSDGFSADFWDQLFDYITQNPEIFKMIFSPHSTGELRFKFTNMIEGVFRLILTERCHVDINDNELDYLSAFWSSGYVAVIGKWVRNDFTPSKDLIMKSLAELNGYMEKLIAVRSE